LDCSGGNNVLCDVLKMTLKQTSQPCPNCGSFFRRDDVCNACGELAPVIEIENKAYSLAGRAPIGKVWNSKLHRYTKKSDIIKK
jgi:ribosomal protein L32